MTRPICDALVCLGLLALATVACPSAVAEPRYPGKSWERAASPEQLGWSAGKLKAARDYAATLHTAAVMVVVDGVVLDEWGQTTRRFNVHSIRKSLLSALYGIHGKTR